MKESEVRKNYAKYLFILIAQWNHIFYMMDEAGEQKLISA